MTIYFSHGKESGPWGRKITALAEIARRKGIRVESIDYRDLPDPDDRARRLVEACRGESEPIVLVGSSMGGYVSAAAAGAIKPTGLFLMAPAFFLPGYCRQEIALHGAKTVIVHGWRDDIVPPDNSIRVARQNRSELHLIDDGHQLLESLPLIALIFSEFLDSLAV